MNDFLTANQPAALAAMAVAILVVGLVILRRRRRARTLRNVLNSIAFEQRQNLVIPSADDGEIQLEYLVLTAQGLLVIDVKDVKGAVFGSDKMQDWTVIDNHNRFQFSNPQPALYDRIAAVRQIVRQVPVAGRVVFLDGAEFTKGVPSLVSNLDDLLNEFGEPDKAAATFKIEAFRPHWEKIGVYAGDN